MELNDKKESEIKTAELSVAGNVMSWHNTIIQLSNISSLSTVSLELKKFPFWTIVALLIGLIFLKYQMLIAIIAFGLAGVVIYLWYRENERLKSQKNLIIMMNSGKTFIICFEDKQFLKKVYAVLCTIIAERNHSSKHIKININNSTISGEANVLNDLIL